VLLWTIFCTALHRVAGYSAGALATMATTRSTIDRLPSELSSLCK